jgi:hypothetical protein
VFSRDAPLAPSMAAPETVLYPFLRTLATQVQIRDADEMMH